MIWIAKYMSRRRFFCKNILVEIKFTNSDVSWPNISNEAGWKTFDLKPSPSLKFFPYELSQSLRLSPSLTVPLPQSKVIHGVLVHTIGENRSPYWISIDLSPFRKYFVSHLKYLKNVLAETFKMVFHALKFTAVSYLSFCFIKLVSLKA